MVAAALRLLALVAAGTTARPRDAAGTTARPRDATGTTARPRDAASTRPHDGFARRTDADQDDAWFASASHVRLAPEDLVEATPRGLAGTSERLRVLAPDDPEVFSVTNASDGYNVLRRPSGADPDVAADLCGVPGAPATPATARIVALVPLAHDVATDVALRTACAARRALRAAVVLGACQEDAYFRRVDLSLMNRGDTLARGYSADESRRHRGAQIFRRADESR